jgi:hypothetical protein
MNLSGMTKTFLIIIGLTFVNISYADNLGRIFTSADERQQLEKLRNKKEEQEKFVVEEVKKIEKPIVQKELLNRDKITLKGLVHRSDGKNAAWINNTNTYEGDLDTQFIEVPDNKIKADNVTIIMPDDNVNIELRVGEEFVPEPIERDVLDTQGDM